MELIGELAEIIYKNDINSYTIALLETDEEIFTVVGYLPFINIGDNLKLTGKFMTHPEYGKQFKIETFEKVIPETEEAIEKYLVAGNIKGIGPVTAKRIVETFGKETIAILKTEPEKLSIIKGITDSKAIEIGQIFNENLDLWQIIKFLDKFSIPTSAVQAIYEKLGKETIKKIEENPYILVDLIHGLDFKQIDKMAIDLGIDYSNPKRIQTAIKYSLNIITYNGHTCVVKENLIEFVHNLLNVSEDLIESEFINLKVNEEIYTEERDKSTWVYLELFYKAEEYIAQKLLALDKADNTKKIKNIKKEIKIQEEKSNIILSEKQVEAVQTVNENNVCIITGGPGTGKTTIIRSIIEIYNTYGKKVVLCAPTGRAAKRMTEATGRKAQTLHRLLEIGKFKEELQLNDAERSITPIDADIIIIDEMSMVDTLLMNYLLKAVYLGTKLVLVGDIDQLPSVGPGTVLKSLIKSEKFITIRLDKIFRQAAKSKIILNAHNVNHGMSFITSDDAELKQDFFYIKEVNKEKALYQILSLCKERLKKFGNYDFFKNIQVITPSKKGILGTKELNKYLQEELNPKSEKKKERHNGSNIYRVGDRIMQTKNNYDIYWERHTESSEYGSGIFNGEMGSIVEINEEEKNIKVKFDDEKVCWYMYQDLEQIEHAYAITVHKSQGSEFDVVILPILNVPPMLLTRNLLYTAITRAKKLLIIISNDKTIDFMINNTDSKNRNSGLEYKLSNI